MTLDVSGDQARGNYGFGEEAISGTVEGDRFIFDYDGGKGEFTLWSDGATFTGTFSSPANSGYRGKAGHLPRIGSEGICFQVVRTRPRMGREVKALSRKPRMPETRMGAKGRETRGA